MTCQIIASNSIDEYLIRSLDEQGATIDMYGVGERLITSKSAPVFGGVYKLVAVEKNGVFQPRIKVSENEEKVTNPGVKVLYRAYDDEDKAMGDILALEDESLEEMVNNAQMIEVHPNLNHYVTNFISPKKIKRLQQVIFDHGKLVYRVPALEETRKYVQYQLENEIWEEEQRFENPHIHYVNLTDKLYQLKMDMYRKAKDR